jgi:predicted AlkP superfamily pyrophosphatase or phosphodiesterase
MGADVERRILLLQVAGLGYNFLAKSLGKAEVGGLVAKPLGGLFPALTCPVQATMRTAAPASDHGIVGNGFFSAELWKPLFWEQSSRLVQGPRIWDDLRRRGGTVGQLFIQQSLGSDADIVYSPAPIHKHHGGMILDSIALPEELHTRLHKELGVFPLRSYWGPLASVRSSRWIAAATESVMAHEKPEFLYTYIPHLDYALQRYGPDSPAGRKACREVDAVIARLAAQSHGYDVIVFGDYPITPATGVVFPNKVLRRHGWLRTRQVRQMLYPYLPGSQAFCVVDHQIAHVHVWDKSVMQTVRESLQALEGVDRVLDEPAKTEAGIDHPRSGDFVLVAKRGYWFDYRWWNSPTEAPDYATHVDIHNKPGYDPCELFFGWPPMRVSQNPSRVHGTHGRLDADEPVVCASNVELPDNPRTLLELARSIKTLVGTIS